MGNHRVLYYDGDDYYTEHVDNATFCKCSGIKDSHGINIYEHDLIKDVANGVRHQKITHAFGELTSMAWSADNSSLVYIKNQQVYIYNVQYKWNKQVELPQFTDGYVTHIKWTNNE